MSYLPYKVCGLPVIICAQGTLIASVVVGSIQWGSLEAAHWVVWACWYGTLLLSLVSVMLAFYLSLLLSNFAINSRGINFLLEALHMPKNKMRARWASLFALQIPIMLLSYALIAYILGLGLLIIRPLWNDPWGPMSLVSGVHSCNISNSMAPKSDILDRLQLYLEFGSPSAWWLLLPYVILYMSGMRKY